MVDSVDPPYATIVIDLTFIPFFSCTPPPYWSMMYHTLEVVGLTLPYWRLPRGITELSNRVFYQV